MLIILIRIIKGNIMYKQGTTDFFTALRTVAMPADANFYGDIFGGWILSQMDLAGGVFSSKIAKAKTTTVAVDGMVFHSPVYIGDEVSCYCKLEKIGRTSMTITIESWARTLSSEEERKVTEGRFTYVAINAEGKPMPVKEEDR